MKALAGMSIIIVILGIIENIIDTSSKLEAIFWAFILLLWVVGLFMFIFWYDVTEY